MGEDAFRETLPRVVERTAVHGEFVWIDTDHHTTTDAALDAFEHHPAATDGPVEVCVQATPRRTPEHH